MSVYGNDFYFEIKDGAYQSAQVVAPLVLVDREVSSAIDVGCGQGWWGKAFEEAGVAEVVGVDGDYVENPVINFVPHNLAVDTPDLGKRFDLAICLEVAEHLPEDRSQGFVDDLCAYSDVVLFSAAIPFQTGTHHINCQWLSYWAERFANNGYGIVDEIRWKIWNDDRVEDWYRQNIVIFDKNVPVSVDIKDVVHPKIHYWGR